jgi:phenylalanyl-tRNA synthetase beta chain
VKITLDWLRDFVPVSENGHELAEALTLAGLEVDSVQAVAGACPGVVIAEILEQRAHPNADRLSICRVTDGSAEREIVCGAPNAAAGIKVPFAPVGTELPGGMKIRSAKIRGVTSEGMLCSAKELQISDDAAGLLVLDGGAPLGESLSDYLKLEDAILDIDLTPNRGDCFSVLGIAREIAARKGEAPLDESLDCVEATSDRVFAVELSDTEACPRFAGRVLSGLARQAHSPDWLKERLRRAGLRPIHPVVDVTNYVMLEYGQPLHAYRLDRLTGGIDVRLARSGETLTLLDERELTLDNDTLVIADGSGAIGLAGIMGGLSTAVDATTEDIFLESAYFSPVALQGRARRYGLHTDASVRFERGVDPSGQERAIERATALLLEIAGGQAGPVVLAEDASKLPVPVPIELRSARLRRLLGVDVSASEVSRLLEQLGMLVEPRNEAWRVTAPSYRFDIAIEEDLIEEIGRMVGYDQIPIVRGQSEIMLGTASERLVSAERLRDLLVARGFNEIVSFGFTDAELQTAVLDDAEAALLANPISRDLAVLRRSLWPGLLQSAQHNQSHQLERCRLFECGTVFTADGSAIAESTAIAGLATGPRWPVHWDGDSAAADFFDLKGDLEVLLSEWRGDDGFAFVAERHPALKPSSSARIYRGGMPAGWIGELHPSLQKRLDLKHAVQVFEIDLQIAGDTAVPKFRDYSRFPSVRRDLAVVVADDVAAADLTKHVRDVLGAALTGCEIFDLYRGRGVDTGRKSVGIGLILQDASRTLTDQETDDMIEQVVRRLEQKLGATIRS